MSARILLLSRAAELEHRAGARDFGDLEGDDADRKRQQLLDHAWTLRAEFGQSTEVIDAAQQWNYQRGQRRRQ